MKNCLLVILGLALASGCESFRHQYVPDSNAVPQTQRRYSLKGCSVYQRSSRVKENHRSVMDARSFDDEALRRMERAYPGVFSENGIPVSIKLCYDMDRLDMLNPGLVVLDVLLFLGTAGVVPLVSATDEFTEVELCVGEEKAKSPRIGVAGSSRCIIWTLGLNLLFPFDEPTDSRFSKCARACVGMADENHSFFVDSRCREAAYAYAVAVALAEHEKATDAKSQAGEVDVGDIPL